jgi:hypothetical protein
MLKILRKMSSSAETTEWGKYYTEWVARSMASVAEDGRDMVTEGFKLLSELSENMTAGLAEAGQATSATVQAASRTAAGMQAAAAEEGAATAQDTARMAARMAQRPKQEGART